MYLEKVVFTLNWQIGKIPDFGQKCIRMRLQDDKDNFFSENNEKRPIKR